MTGYAIMRCSKIKSINSLASSLKHNYREQETLNADPERTPDNIHEKATSTAQAIANARANLPEKRRKDAVVAVEYMITASPEWFKKASKSDINEFFESSKAFIKEKYGESNIIASSVHLDEKTPHIAVYVTPITKDGRLSAKEYIGNKKQMSKDQDNFHKKVENLGLSRGIKGSKATHTRVSQYYSNLNDTPTQIKADDVEPKLIRKKLMNSVYESGYFIAERLNEKYIKPLNDAILNERIERRKAEQETQTIKNQFTEYKNTIQKEFSEYKETHKLNTEFIDDEVLKKIGYDLHSQQMINRRHEKLKNQDDDVVLLFDYGKSPLDFKKGNPLSWFIAIQDKFKEVRTLFDDKYQVLKGNIPRDSLVKIDKDFNISAIEKTPQRQQKSKGLSR